MIQCLRDREHRVCDKETKEKEVKHLKKVFTANGYPKLLTRRTLNKPLKEKTQPQQSPDDEGPEAEQEEEKKNMLLLPYIKGVSEKIDRICAPLGIRTVFKSHNTLGQLLMKVKAETPEDLKKGVVYKVPCADCTNINIGETGRNLRMRLKEHQYAVKRKDEKNGITIHAQQSEHNVDWEAAKVRATEGHLMKRKVLEAILIQESSNTNNLNAGLILNPIWYHSSKSNSHEVIQYKLWAEALDVGRIQLDIYTQSCTHQITLTNADLMRCGFSPLGFFC